MTDTITPLPRQHVALTCPAFEIMFGGQKGGSKSFWLCLECVAPLQRAHQIWTQTGGNQRECRVVIFRRNLKDLTDIINKSHSVLQTVDPQARYNANEKTWHFTSGATVEFHHLDGPEDHSGWNGQAITCLMFDQVEEISEDVYSFLVAQVRPSNQHYKDMLKVRCTANPGGRHGDWVKRRFVDPHPAGNKIINVEVENRDGRKVSVSRAYIPSALADNPYLNDDGQYEARLRASLPDHQIKMYLEGDWNVVVGAFFSSLIRPDKLFFEFRRQFPRGIPASWEMRFGLDWGSTAPAAGVFGCKDNDGRIWIVGEHVKPGITGRKFGESMKNWFAAQRWSDDRKMSHEDPYGLIDHQAEGRYGSEGASAADGIREMGWRVFAANKDRYAGIEQICERLQPRADGFPSVRIARDMCPQLASDLQRVRINPRDPQDYDPDDSPHAVDALRFLLMDWPVMEVAGETAQDKQHREWEAYLRKARERQAQHDGAYIGGGYE